MKWCCFVTDMSLSIWQNKDCEINAKLQKQQILKVHRESKKGCHPNHGYNFVNS